ncbi:MAG: hypothetical protein Aurels2KO_09900 [Aureliella sp.]
MRMKHAAVLLLLAVIALPGSSRGDEKELSLTEEKYYELLDSLRPGDEPWLTIPWKTRLLDAQRAASRDAKPIFIWAMDGHPLGCT